jgi:ABC-2 type transport system ATP-binding protein
MVMAQALSPGGEPAADVQPRTAPLPAVQLVGVEKSYGLFRPRPALRGVSLRIERGECYGLAGPNGAGKTTLIKVMLGLVTPDAGEARLFGHSPEQPEVRRRVGFVPEAAELPPGATPLQLVKRWARLRGLPVQATLAQGETALRRLGMGELLGREVHRFSKGEKQRTLLALSLLGEPELLVLDEPTDGLDPLGRALVRRVIQEECAAGRTVFVNSHLLSETERVCTRVGILHRGQLVREEVLGPQGASADRATTALTVATPLPAELASDLSLRRPAADQGGAHVYLLEHDGLDDLNRAIDRVRHSGARLVEVRRVRRDLEEALTLVATAAPGDEPAANVDAGQLVEAEPAPQRPFRGVRAAYGVAREIASDLVARKMTHVAAAGAGLALFVIWLAVRNQVIQGMAATARQFRAGGMLDDAAMAAVIGRGAAAGQFWMLLFGSVFLSALFAPPLLEPRRSALLLAQPLSRADLARGILASVLAQNLVTYSLFGVAMFGALRWLGLPVSPRVMLVPGLTAAAFSAVYAVVLLVTYFFPSGIAAGFVGVGALIALVVAGNLEAAQAANAHGLGGFFFGLLPKLIGLHHQAMRLGAGGGVAAFPVVSTLCFALAVVLVVQLVARRSER